MSSLANAEGTSLHADAPPNLLLAVHRLAAAAGSGRILSIGTPAYRLDGEFAVTTAQAGDDVGLSADDLVVTKGDLRWEAFAGARFVVAVAEAAAGEPFARVEDVRRDAAAAGWATPYASLFHVGAGTTESPRRESLLLVACKPGDPLAEALETGPLSPLLDPAADAVGGAGARPARVLIASHEFTGPTGNGGIGTAYHSLAHSLSAHGHEVTVLYTGLLPPAAHAQAPLWRERFAARGIDFSILGGAWDIPVRNPHHAVRRAYEFHRWLADAHAERPFDVVHLPETIGCGAFAMTAKALGLAYAGVEFVVGTHSSTRWVAECNREGLENLDVLTTEQLERVTVAMADAVLSPSAYLVDYMRERGWQLPERTFVLPYARPQSVRELGADRRPVSAATPPDELVFFGRLETRKGLEAFCDAVDLLHAEGSPFRRVTFVGRPERVLGEDSTAFVTRRAAAWSGVEWTILPDLSHDDAIDYLGRARCVVAIPSLVDNSPNTVYEAVALGVPFVASRAGGTGEILAADDLAASTFDGWRDADSLEPPAFDDAEAPFDAGALAAALRAKAQEPAAAVSPAVSDGACDRAYDRWHRALAARGAAAAAPPSRALPTAAVCIVDASAAELRRIVSRLTQDEQAPDEIVAVVGEQALDGPIEGVDVVVASGRATGPARRRIAQRTRADVLIVLRGNEDPDVDLVGRVRAAMATDVADVLSLIARDPASDREVGTNPESPRESAPADLRAFVPVSGPAVAAAIYPALSVGPYAIRRETLDRLGGYAADTWGALVDEELLSRAALAGTPFAVFPDPLATTLRDDDWTEFRAHYLGFAPIPEVVGGEAEIRRLRPFRRRLDAAVADLPALLVGAQRSLRREIEHRRAVQANYERRIAEFDELVQIYEANLEEHRGLIALYERQKAELRLALEDPRMDLMRIGQRIERKLPRPIARLSRRGARIARERTRRLRRSQG